MPDYQKQRSGEELWKIVHSPSGWTVTMGGLPLDELEEHEADETVRMLETGELTPDTPQAPPKN